MQKKFPQTVAIALIIYIHNTSQALGTQAPSAIEESRRGSAAATAPLSPDSEAGTMITALYRDQPSRQIIVTRDVMMGSARLKNKTHRDWDKYRFPCTEERWNELQRENQKLKDMADRLIWEPEFLLKAGQDPVPAVNGWLGKHKPRVEKFLSLASNLAVNVLVSEYAESQCQRIQPQYVIDAPLARAMRWECMFTGLQYSFGAGAVAGPIAGTLGVEVIDQGPGILIRVCNGFFDCLAGAKSIFDRFSAKDEISSKDKSA